MIKIIAFLLISLPAMSQPKKTSLIKVKGVSFKEVGEKLLDAGFIIEKSDSIFQTIKTEFKESRSNQKQLELSLFVRIKDSVAYVTGKTYNSSLIGAKFIFDSRLSKEALMFDIENIGGTFKKIFAEMNDFALSFGKPVEYLIQ